MATHSEAAGVAESDVSEIIWDDDLTLLKQMAARLDVLEYMASMMIELLPDLVELQRQLDAIGMRVAAA